MANHIDLAVEKFGELVRVMERLRSTNGCPWDRKQTFDSIKSHLLEEAYEVMDAIDRRDWQGLEDELGDLLLQPVFFAQLAAEQKLFNIADSLARIVSKLIRRHPHIFGDARAETPEDVMVHWNAIKQQEKAERGAAAAPSILDDVPRALPALMECDKIGKKAAGQGFDWDSIQGALAKLKEEADELEEARTSADRDHIEHELGDLLFTVVNVSRFLKVDPEQALRKANGRFRFRFAQVETSAGKTGLPMNEIPPATLEEFWQAAKLLERSR